MVLNFQNYYKKKIKTKAKGLMIIIIKFNNKQMKLKIYLIKVWILAKLNYKKTQI